MSQRNHKMTTINIGSLPDQILRDFKALRQRKIKRVPKPFYENMNARRITMHRDQTLPANEVRVARKNKLPLFELVLNNTTMDITRYRGKAAETIQKMPGGILYEVLPTGFKQKVN